MDFSQILVIILAIALFVLLTMSIIFAFYLIKVIRSIREIADKADLAADNLVAFSSTVKKGAMPASAAGFVSMIIRKAMKNKRKD